MWKEPKHKLLVLTNVHKEGPGTWLNTYFACIYVALESMPQQLPASQSPSIEKEKDKKIEMKEEEEEEKEDKFTWI